MNKLESVTLANPAKIPCSMRTIKEYWTAGQSPWVHSSQAMEAIVYLAIMAEMDESKISALNALLDEVSSLLKNLSDSLDRAPVNGAPIKGH